MISSCVVNAHNNRVRAIKKPKKHKNAFFCGKWVWIRDASQAHGRKIQPTWAGPCVVKQVLSNHRVVVQMHKGTRPIVVEMHVDIVHPCILSHRGEPSESV